jgi:two-component system, chemotaxis family, response regulator WspF
MRIGIAHSRAAAAETLRRVVTHAPHHHVVWSVSSGAEAVAMCALQAPDLVLLHLGVDGVDATRRITAAAACAIVIITDSVQANAARVFEAMGLGALDAIDMPEGCDADRESAAPLLAKIATIARLIGERTPKAMPPPVKRVGLERRATSLVAIGASAGGPPALAALLRALPRDFPAAVVIVQHVDSQFAVGMAAWLGEQSQLPVRLADEGDHPAMGTVLLAGGNDHLVFTGPERFGYTREPQQAVYRPSIDVFFHSVIKHWRGETVGVLLTGMGRDGAAGLKAMRNRGLYTIAQDEASSAVYGMPKAAATMNAAVDILPIELIPARLVRALAREGVAPEAVG